MVNSETVTYNKDCHITPFQSRVYRVVSQIPRGMVMTYQGLAQAIGCASSQAVGQALRRNPFAPTVPCHRVIKSNLRAGGYVGQQSGAAIKCKLDLLAAEGVVFEHGVLLDPDKIFTLKSAEDR